MQQQQQQQQRANETSSDDRTQPLPGQPRLAPMAIASSASPSPLGVLSPTSGLAVSAGSDDGTILFVGDLSRGVKEEELEALFARYGTLLAVDIKRDKLTHNNLGYGFVQLSSRQEATRAKLALQGREVFGRKIRIGWAQKNTTLFVGDLDGTITTNQLIKAFEPFGHIIAEETFVKQPSGKYVRMRTHTGRRGPRGARYFDADSMLLRVFLFPQGFVRFGSREDAERAKSEMNHKMLGSRQIRIGWGYTHSRTCTQSKAEQSRLLCPTPRGRTGGTHGFVLICPRFCCDSATRISRSIACTSSSSPARCP